MPETVGVPFHAIILQALSVKFAAPGEIVVVKIINEAGDFRVQSATAKQAEESEEFPAALRPLLKSVAIDRRIPQLPARGAK